MELAIINGTYRDNSNGKTNGMQGTRLQIAPVLQPNPSAAFRLPSMVAPCMQGLVNTSILRPVSFGLIEG